MAIIGGIKACLHQGVKEPSIFIEENWWQKTSYYRVRRFEERWRGENGNVV